MAICEVSPEIQSKGIQLFKANLIENHASGKPLSTTENFYVTALQFIRKSAQFEVKSCMAKIKKKG